MYIPTSMATTFTRTRTRTNPKDTATPKQQLQSIGWIAFSDSLAFIKPSGRCWSASYTALPARPPSPCSCSPPFRDPYWAVAYLLVFGIGTIAGMMIITPAIALPFKYSQQRFARFNRTLQITSGVISLGFGMFIVYKMGYVSGMFTSHPKWTPE